MSKLFYLQMILEDVPPSIEIFTLFGQRFGAIEPHFKNYKLLPLSFLVLVLEMLMN
jgi:hypothetical protein